MPRADEVARAQDAGITQCVIGVGRARAAVAIRYYVAARIEAVLRDQLRDFLRRLETTILKELGPFNVDRMGYVSTPLAASGVVFTAPFKIVAHVEQTKIPRTCATVYFNHARQTTRSPRYR